MPIVAYLLGATMLAGIVRFIVSVIGVGIVSYVGFELLLSTVMSYASGLGSVGGSVAGLAGLSGVDTAINLILSGCTVRIALMAVKRFRAI